MTVKVLVLGSTGYLGGTILTELEQTDYAITALVRGEKVGKLEGRGATAITGTFSDVPAIESIVAAHDVVINAATSDDLDLTKAINRGLAARKNSGAKAVLVHISGVQLIESAETGDLEDVPIYDDMDVEQIKGISDSAAHRLIDLEVARADLAGELIACIVCPGNIWGKGSGPDRVISRMNPDFVTRALREGHPVYAGSGENVWAQVNVDDVAKLIVLCAQHGLQTDEPKGFGRFYFAAKGERSTLDYVRPLGELLHRGGAIADPTPQSVPATSPRAPIGPNKTTARCKARRAVEELGWAPAGDWKSNLEADIVSIVENLQ